MKTAIPVSSIVAWVGLDWADQRHVISLQAVNSDQVESFVLEQKPEALNQWATRLRTRFPQGYVAVALEQVRGAVLYALMSYDFMVLYPVPAKSAARYREAFYPSGSKNDPSDAQLLREMVRSHRDRLRAWLPDAPLTRQIRLMTEHRRKLVHDRTRLTNRLTALLKEYFPQALEWAGTLASPQACEFLTRWPSLAALQQTPCSELRQFYLSHGEHPTDCLENRLQSVREAQPLTRDPAITQASAFMAQVLVEQLRTLFPAIQRFDLSIRQLFRQHSDQKLFSSFPGAGRALAPRLLAAWGDDRDRYESAADIQCFSGIAPVTVNSGKTKWVHWRLACPKFLRQTFHEFAALSRFWSPWAKAYYLQLRSHGWDHHAAVRSLAFKWIRIMYRCWKDRTPYDESRYQRALQRRNSSLALTLCLASNQGARRKPGHI